MKKGLIFAAMSLACLGASGASAAPLKFTALNLENGWEFYASYTRVPGVDVDSKGIVHLRGAMHQTTGSNVEAFVLPPAFRPNKKVFVPADTFNGSTGGLEIDPDGGRSQRPKQPEQHNRSEDEGAAVTPKQFPNAVRRAWRAR